MQTPRWPQATLPLSRSPLLLALPAVSRILRLWNGRRGLKPVAAGPSAKQSTKSRVSLFALQIIFKDSLGNEYGSNVSNIPSDKK